MVIKEVKTYYVNTGLTLTSPMMLLRNGSRFVSTFHGTTLYDINCIFIL